MNKADNDASTRAIDSLINYEVRISFTNTNTLIDLCCFYLQFGYYYEIHLIFFSFFFLFTVLQTVKYFNNEVHETDHYDKYLMSK